MDLPAQQQQMLDRAINCHRSGNLTEAESLYRSLLDTDPDQADALHYLGVLVLRSGQFDEGIELIQRAINVRPRYIDAVLSLGNGLHVAHRYDEAVKQFRHALTLGPPTPTLLSSLGSSLVHLGHHPEAVEHFNSALRMRPELTETRRLLAHALLNLGRTDEAVQEITNAASRGQPTIPIMLSMGNILKAAGRVGDAIGWYQDILRTRPDLLPVLRSLARTYREIGRIEQASEQYKNLLTHYPDNVEGHFDLGVVYQEMGNIDQALAEYRKAVELDSNCAKAWHCIAIITDNAFDDSEIKTLLNLQQAPGFSENKRMRLAFALGTHFEKAGEPEHAATQYVLANAFKRNELDYDIENDLHAYANITACFDTAFLDKWASSGVADNSPIFIVGMPRSGTTLVEQILASHPRVFGAGEHTLLTQSVLETFPINDGPDYTEALLDATPEKFQTVARKYLDGLPKVDADFITDKLPHNFLHLGTIGILFPNATIVHCKRDPRDTCFSIYKHLFAPNSHPYAYNLEELARYYNGYSALMNHWNHVMAGKIHTLEYEVMIDNQEQTTRRLLDACNLDWNPVCLEFHKLRRPVPTLSSAQVRQPIYRGSLGAWRPYENMLEPLLTTLD